ncbi:hypothetical protein D1007_40191 [Hordeum vulgare]|nr:hypothetical protein D1007_40191 [Hordeum vulgare]
MSTLLVHATDRATTLPTIASPSFFSFFYLDETSNHPFLILQRREMSSPTSASHPLWPVYGPMPMKPCIECPCTTPLTWWTTKETKNGNYMRHFVKCESKREGKIMEKCNHFEWIDEYITRLDLKGAVTRELNLPLVVENLVSHSVVPTVVDADMKGELKKMNKNLK